MVDRFTVAAKGFVQKEGKVLVLKEAGEYEEGTNPGKWQIPGGRLEHGEEYAEALKREVKEESGLEVEILHPFYIDEWRPTINGEKWQIIGIFSRCRPVSGEISLSGEHTEYRWINPEDYRNYDIIENLGPVFEEFQSRNSGGSGR